MYLLVLSNVLQLLKLAEVKTGSRKNLKIDRKSPCKVTKQNTKFTLIMNAFIMLWRMLSKFDLTV